MKHANDVTIVIPQHNSAELTSDCIQSIREYEPMLRPIVVVDDGSTRPSRELILCAERSGIRFIEQPHRGVSAAWNRGAATAETPFLVFLNNDVLLSGPVISRLTAPLRTGAAVMCGVAFRREAALSASIMKQLPTDRFLQGWCMAVALETFGSLGGFDEALRVYFSDTDFQCRLILKYGPHQNVLAAVAGLPLHHLGHRTAHKLPERWTVWRQDREAFMAKWPDESGDF